MNTATMNPAFKQHENDDQEPTQVALECEKIYHIGGNTEYEQQCPYKKVNLDRMLLTDFRHDLSTNPYQR